MGFWETFDESICGSIGAVVGGGIGMVDGPLALVTVPAGFGIGASLGVKAGQGLYDALSGNSPSPKPEAAQVKPGAAGTVPSSASTPSSPAVPKSPSADQGLAAQAAADDRAQLQALNQQLQDLEQNQGSSVSGVVAGAQLANSQLQALHQEVETEITELTSTTSTAQTLQIQQLVATQLLQMQSIIQQEQTSQLIAAGQANASANQYANVGAGGSGAAGGVGGGATGGSGTGAAAVGGSGTGAAAGGSPTGGSGTGVAAVGGSATGAAAVGGSATGVYPNGAYPSAMSSNGLSSYGSGADASLMSSMLPEMIMPAMMLPSMMSGMGANSMGAHQTDSLAPQGTQTVSAATPSGGSPKSQDVNGSDNPGGAGGSDQNHPAAEAATQPASAQPAGNSSAAPVSNIDVKLPDGTTTHAPNAQAANAVRAALTGADPSDAYQRAGVTLPPPGTPVLNPVAPPDLQPGDIGIWKDHQVMALGDSKVLVSGQVQPESSIGSSPDFLGWMRPTQSSSAPTAAPAPAAALAAAPTPAAPVGAPAGAGTQPGTPS